MSVSPERDNRPIRSCPRCGGAIRRKPGPGRWPKFCSAKCAKPPPRQTQHVTRVLSDPRAAQNFRGQFAALTGDEILELRRRRREGWKKEHLAAAYGISTRTVERYLRWSEPVIVAVGAWRASFCLRPPEAGPRRYVGSPVQVTPWELDREAAA